MYGADDQDRTGMASLEGWGSTIELHPRVLGAVLLYCGIDLSRDYR